MAKLKIIKTGIVIDNVPQIQLHYYCKGCGHIHAVSLNVHKFNGDYDKPTFSPSLVQNFTPGRLCHSFINDGMIQYLHDCWHDLRGQTIELPEIEDHLNTD